jgi:O-antigen/teichoic acid export membrane protein
MDFQNSLEGVLRILRNFVYLTAGKFLGDGFTFIFFIVLARTFGQEGIGQYSFAMALTGVLMVIADFGIYNLSVRDISRDKESVAKYYGRLLAVRLLLSATALGVLLAISSFLPLPDEIKRIILLIGAYQITLTLVDGFGAVFVAREDMHITSLLDCSLRVTTSLLGITVVLLGGSLTLAVASLPVVALIYAAVGYLYTVRRCGVLPISVTAATVCEVLYDAFPYAMHALLEQLSSRVALLFVGFMLGAAAVGVFNAAYRVIIVLFFVPAFAGLAIFPVASRLYLSSREQLQELYQNTLNLIVVVGVPMAAGIWLIAPQLIETLYGSEFLESTAVLRWLAWVLLAVFLRSITATFLTACDRQKYVTKSYLVVACIGGALQYWLIVKFGVIGAAIATLSAEVLLIILLGSQLNNLLEWQKIGARIVISSTAVTTFLVPFLIWDIWPLGVTIVCAIFVYCTVIFVFSDIRGNELRFLFNCLPNSEETSKTAARQDLPSR